MGTRTDLRIPFADLSNISKSQQAKKRANKEEHPDRKLPKKKTAIEVEQLSEPTPKVETTKPRLTTIRPTSSDLHAPDDSEDEHETKEQEEIALEPSLCTFAKWNFDPELSTYLKLREQDHFPLPDYIVSHPALKPLMRRQLYDWMMEVGEEYKLTKITVHIAFYLTDKFLSRFSPVPTNKLQLVGATSLLIASKMEEVKSICIADLVFLCEDCYTRGEFKRMEGLIVQYLEWKLLPVTPCMWLKIYLYKKYNPLWAADIETTASFPQKEFVRMMEIIDYSVLDYRSIRFPPSHIASAVLYLHWGQECTEAIENITELKYKEVEGCVNWMRPFLSIPPSPISAKLAHDHPMDYHEIQYRNPDALSLVQKLIQGGDNNNLS